MHFPIAEWCSFTYHLLCDDGLFLTSMAMSSDHQPLADQWLSARHGYVPVLAVHLDECTRQALVCIVFLLAYYKGGFNRSEFPVHRLPRAGYFRTPQVRAQPWAGRAAALQMGEKRLEIGGEEADGDGEEDDAEELTHQVDGSL